MSLVVFFHMKQLQTHDKWIFLLGPTLTEREKGRENGEKQTLRSTSTHFTCTHIYFNLRDFAAQVYRKTPSRK